MESYRTPYAHWLGSPNYTPNRNGHDMTQPSWIVLHTMVTSVGGANSRFQLEREQASAHYGIGLDGRLYQWVDERNAAWANGATGRGGRGDNLDSISIEHEDLGNYDGPRTPELYAASARLVAEIAVRYGVPVDRDHVIGHRECDYASTRCPDALDVDLIVRMALDRLAPPPPLPHPPPVTTEEARPVFTQDFNGQLHVFYADQDGHLVHFWYPAGQAGWGRELLADGLQPGTLLSGGVTFGQLHVFGQRTDAKVQHVWYAPGSPAWGAEVLG